MFDGKVRVKARRWCGEETYVTDNRRLITGKTRGDNGRQNEMVEGEMEDLLTMVKHEGGNGMNRTGITHWGLKCEEWRERIC